MRVLVFLGLIFWTKSVSAASMVADTAVYARTFCSNQIVIVNNHLYSPLNPTGIEVIPGGAANGMDSIFLVQLTFNAPVETFFSATICEGDTLYINNSPYHQGHFSDTEIFENGSENGCDSIVHVDINFRVQPFSYLIDTLCMGESIMVNGTEYNRDNNSGLEVIQSAAIAGCDSLVYVRVFFRQPWVDLGEDRSVIQGDTVCITALSRFPAESVVWQPEPICADPLCTSFCTSLLSESQTYQIQFTDVYGCVSTDEIKIAVRDEHQVYGPNIFRPGEAAPNDRFFIRADDGVLFIRQLMVYDRWGEPVFQAHDIPNDDSAYQQGWDGRWHNRDLPAGVYTWWAELENFTGRRFLRSGDVGLAR